MPKALVAAWVPPQAGERSSVQLALHISWDLLRWHILWPRPVLSKETRLLLCHAWVSSRISLGQVYPGGLHSFFFFFLSFKPLLGLYWSPVISRFLACLGVQQPASVIWVNLWCFSDSFSRQIFSVPSRGSHGWQRFVDSVLQVSEYACPLSLLIYPHSQPDVLHGHREFDFSFSESVSVWRVYFMCTKF